MPSVLAPVSYEPIRAVRVLSQQGALPQLLRVPEKLTQTFKLGVPLVLNGGYVQEAAFGGAETVYGVSAEAGHNYAADAGSATYGLPPYLPTASELAETASAPPNQASAVVIPVGAALRDGMTGLYAANGTTIFSIALKAGQVFTQAMVGATYGLTKDAGGFWYLDNTDTTGDNAVATCVGVDSSSPNTVAGGCRVFFYFISTLRAFK